MTEETHRGSERVEITTPEGYVFDLAPLIDSAKTMRRNALQDAELERGLGINKPMIGATLVGMQVAVGKILGDEAEALFDLHVNGPKRPRP